MSLNGCLNIAVNTGRMTRERADEILESARGFADEQVSAAEKALDAAFTESALRRKQAALQALKKVEAIGNLRTHEDGQITALNSILARDITAKASWENVDQATMGIADSFWRQLVEPLDAMRTKMFGLTQDTEIAQSVVRAIFGEKAADGQAASFAKSLSDVFEQVRVMFNESGGHILKRKNWFPISHNARFVGEASKLLKSDLDSETAWVNFIRPKLREDFLTDDVGRALTPDKVNETLRTVYQSITTEGRIELDALAHSGMKMANRHRESRFLTFRSADDWMEYNRVFGNPDIFTTITDYISNMSNEIGLMKVLGPNPEDTFRTLQALAERSLDATNPGSVRAGFQKNYTEALWNVVSGKVNQTKNPGFANALQSIRNVITSARLGSAMLSATADLAFFRQTSAWRGLNSSRAMERYLSLLNPANKADRDAAARASGIVDNWITRALAANRFTEVYGANASTTLADMTMRLSGLSQHTNIGQQAAAMETLATLFDNAGKRYADVPEEIGLQRFLTEEEWNILRSTDGDNGFVSIENLLARTDIDERTARRISRKTLSLTKDIANAAIPVPDARSRAITTAGAQRGTLSGELVRNIAQFKGFPISVIMQHVYAGLGQASRLGKIRYMSELAVASTLMGALALQLKQIAGGKDPLDTDDPKFWFRAFTQGGGAGIFGDFVQAGMQGKNRFGQNLLTTLLGPTSGALNDVLSISLGPLNDALEGDPSSLPSDLQFLVDRYMPIVSSLWYGQLAWQRNVDDQLQMMTDPDAKAKMRRKQRRLLREQNQRYWWRPGERGPDRAPEIL